MKLYNGNDKSQSSDMTHTDMQTKWEILIKNLNNN